MAKKVRVNSKYYFHPVFWDREVPVKEGELVRVVNLFGCPPANSGGMCYINRILPDGSEEFVQMVCTNSLYNKKDHEEYFAEKNE